MTKTREEQIQDLAIAHCISYDEMKRVINKLSSFGIKASKIGKKLREEFDNGKLFKR